MREVNFDALIVQAYERLPKWVREKIQNVAILVEDEPADAERESRNLSKGETLLGLYKGIPLSSRGDMYGIGATLPDTITIYKRPIYSLAESEVAPESSEEVFVERVKQIIADTVWHEFAHHFGINEHDVRAREREKGIEY